MDACGKLGEPKKEEAITKRALRKFNIIFIVEVTALLWSLSRHNPYFLRVVHSEAHEPDVTLCVLKSIRHIVVFLESWSYRESWSKIVGV